MARGAAESPPTSGTARALVGGRQERRSVYPTVTVVAGAIALVAAAAACDDARPRADRTRLPTETGSASAGSTPERYRTPADRSADRPADRKDSIGDADTRPRRDRRVLLAWTPGSLPPDTEARLEDLDAVVHATTVYSGLDWISSFSGRAASRGDPPDGYRFPFEMAVVEPDEYARFVPPRDRDAVRHLGPGDLLFAETERELRGFGIGATVNLEERRLRVEDVVTDVAANGYEALVAAPPPAEWVRADRFVLVRLRNARDRAAVEAELRSVVGRGEPLQTTAAGARPFLRYADSSIPMLIAKRVFGEFGARAAPNGTIEVDPRWKQRSIRTARVPLLGEVRCHRLFLPQLHAALREVKRRGLATKINQYSGCYYPRFIGSDPNGRLSHHSWGIAVDINAAENRFGASPTMDPRIVAIFENNGFIWGGRWLVPDGMHLEWWEEPRAGG